MPKTSTINFTKPSE